MTGPRGRTTTREIVAYRWSARAACLSRGIVINKTTSRDPQFGHRKRLSSRESGKPRPRVQTNVLISNSSRYRHSGCRTMPSCLPAAQRAVIRQPYERASPSVSTGNEDAPPYFARSLPHERMPAALSRAGGADDFGLSSRAIATNSQLWHANDLNSGRSSQSRISPPHFLQVIACLVRVVSPFELDEMAGPTCERPPGVRMPPGKHWGATSRAGIYRGEENKSGTKSQWGEVWRAFPAPTARCRLRPRPRLAAVVQAGC
jgi:hypothetical protein